MDSWRWPGVVTRVRDGRAVTKLGLGRWSIGVAGMRVQSDNSRSSKQRGYLSGGTETLGFPGSSDNPGDLKLFGTARLEFAIL